MDEGSRVIVKRVRTILTAASASAFGLMVIVWLLSYHLNLSQGLRGAELKPSDSIPLLSGYRIGFEDGELWFWRPSRPFKHE